MTLWDMMVGCCWCSNIVGVKKCLYCDTLIVIFDDDGGWVGGRGLVKMVVHF